MKYVNENLYQFRDSKFFDNLFEQKEEMSPADKKKHAQELEKIGMSVVKKCIKNFSDFKKYAGDIWQEYRDFWKSQEDAGLSVEAEKEKIYLYNLYKSNYIVGIIKKDTGMAALTVFNTSAEDKDEYIVFQTQNKDVVNAFVQFYKEDLEATMKQVIANQKAAMEAKKAAEEAKTKEEKENKRKSKIEAFLGESKLDEMNMPEIAAVTMSSIATLMMMYVLYLRGRDMDLDDRSLKQKIHDWLKDRKVRKIARKLSTIPEIREMALDKNYRRNYRGKIRSTIEKYLDEEEKEYLYNLNIPTIEFYMKKD